MKPLHGQRTNCHIATGRLISAQWSLGTSIMNALCLFRMDLYGGKKCFSEAQLAWHYHGSGSHCLVSWSVCTHPEFYRYCCQLLHPLLSELLKWHYCAAVADLGGVRGVQMHPPLAASNVFCVHNCTSPSNDYAAVACSNNNQAQLRTHVSVPY